MSDITNPNRSTNGSTTSSTVGDASSNAVHEFYDGESDDAVSYTIATAVAAARGVDPVELPPLYRSVDVDALDALVNGAAGRQSGPDGYLSFAYAGYDVTVDFDGWVRLDPLPDP